MALLLKRVVKRELLTVFLSYSHSFFDNYIA